MRKYNISTEDLDELLQAHKEHKISLSEPELDVIEKIRNNDTSALRFYGVIDSRIKALKNLNKLDEKLDKEYNKFREETREKTKEEILNKAYELTVKEELKETIKGMDLFELEVIAMLDQKDLLNEFYNDWQNTETPLGEVLEISIDESISMLTRYYEQRKKEKNQARRERKLKNQETQKEKER